MKKLIYTFLTFAILGTNMATCQVGIGTTAPDPASILDLTATNKGFLPPRLSTAQRNAITSPAEGLTIYNTTSKCLQFFTGFAWFNTCTNTSETPPAVVPVGGGVTKAFLPYNLGADTTLDPHIPVVGLQGAYIQWGRRGPNTTGDSRIDWQTASNTSNFAAAPTQSNPNAGALPGWTTAQAADGAWNSGSELLPVKTIDDPCPTGFRVPTISEWVAVVNNNTITRTGPFLSGDTQYGSAIHIGSNTIPKSLTLPVTGVRLEASFTLFDRGSVLGYWSSTQQAGDDGIEYLSGDATTLATFVSSRPTGLPLRCISE